MSNAVSPESLVKKLIYTGDGCRYVLKEGFVREDGQDGLGSSIGEETSEKWISKEELDQYETRFGNPVRQLENNI